MVRVREPRHEQVCGGSVVVSTSSTCSVAPLVRAIVRATLIAGTVVSLSSITTAKACSTSQPAAEDVRFSEWVADAGDITLVRVAAARKLPAGTLVEGGWTDFINPYEFTLQTIERVKGAAPRTFKLVGDRLDASTKGLDARGLENHQDVGLFWTWFHGVCYDEPLLVEGAEYLLFRHTDGLVPSLFGRNAARIRTRDDAWLAAVRVLARNPSLKYGRRARLIDFLTSSRAIVVTRTLTCDRDGVPPHSPHPGKQEIVKQLWGDPITLTELKDAFSWSKSERCDNGQERLIILLGHWPMRLRVLPNQTVDFSGFLDGTDKGMIEDEYQGSRWVAQVELEGPRVWRLTDMNVALAASAKSRAKGH